jgi:hypothetical protein
MFITLTAFTLVSGLSLDMKRNSYLANFEVNEAIICPIFSNPYNYNITDFLVNKCDFIKRNISNYLQEENIQTDVQINTYRVIENLSEFFIDNVDLNSIYTSKYGTVLIDFEKNNNIFSIEIGVKSIGYFSEIDTKTIDFCEETFIDNENNLSSSLSKLNKSFLEFYNKI